MSDVFTLARRLADIRLARAQIRSLLAPDNLRQVAVGARIGQNHICDALRVEMEAHYRGHLAATVDQIDATLAIREERAGRDLLIAAFAAAFPPTGA